MSTTVKTLLEELYALEPSLREKESDITRMIEAMLTHKPDIRIDETFRAELREKLIAQDRVPVRSSSWKFSIIFPIFGTAFASFFVGMFVWNAFFSPSIVLREQKTLSYAPQIQDAPKEAFGKMESLTNPDMRRGDARVNISATSEKTTLSTPQDMPTSTPLVGQKMVVSPDIGIMPIIEPQNFVYSYTGTLPELPNELPVYKKGLSSEDGKNIAEIIQNIPSSGIDLKKLQNTHISNLTLEEKRPFGYTVNFDFNYGTVAFYQNWAYWTQPTCSVTGCESLPALAEKDIPTDVSLIEMTRSWLSEYSIDMTGYAEPTIDRSWKIWYARAQENGENTSIPESYTVTYPLLVDSMPVYEEGGMPRGITFTVDIRQKKVSSVTGLEKQTLTRSLYPRESADIVTNMIRSGGRYLTDVSSGNKQKGKEVTVTLGTPTLVYIHLYGVYQDGKSDEYYVPAYSFPVSGIADNLRYQVPEKVIVPVVQGWSVMADTGSYATPGVPMIEPAVMMR